MLQRAGKFIKHVLGGQKRDHLSLGKQGNFIEMFKILRSVRKVQS